MNLRTEIDEKYEIALKLKNSSEVNALRLVRSAIKDKDIENRSSTNKELINDQQILMVLQSLIKQRRDSIDSFIKASRNDLIEIEKKEIEIINQFLPKQLNKDEIEKLVNKFITENNLSSIKDMGKIMGFLKSNHAVNIDMGLAGKIAKYLLGK